MSAPTPTSTLKALVDVWKRFDLDGKRASFDRHAASITEQRERHVQSRKALTEATRNFKKSFPAEAPQVTNLLKLYQEEIDALSRRSKATENVFLSLYEDLATIPDPVAGLTIALENSQLTNRIKELEEENKRLTSQLTEIRQESQEIQNQEVKIRRLTSKIQEFEAQLEQMVAERVAAKAEQLQEENRKALELMQEREMELNHQYQQTREELIRLRQAHDLAQNELLNWKTKFDDAIAAKQAEIDVLSTEAERREADIAALERERDRYKELAHSGASSPLGTLVSPSAMPDLELALAQKEIEISQLQDQFQALEVRTSQQLEMLTTENRALKQKLDASLAAVEGLKAQLSAAPSPEEFVELKRQLEVFKAMEFADGVPSTLSNFRGEGTLGSNLEVLLREKNRNLETENTRLKVAVAEREETVADLSAKLRTAEDRIDEQAKLIAKLEEDIEAYGGARGGNAATAPPAPVVIPAPAPIERAASSSLVGTPSSDDGSMLTIVRKQRDRFKTRVQELEAELIKQQKSATKLQNEVGELRADNVKLYEKIKYLQSYQRGDTRSAAAPGVWDLESGTANSTSGYDSTELKYRQLYEEGMNPFLVFNRREQEKRLRDLNAAERMTLRTGRYILSNKYTRMFIFFYSIALHILVFLTLYKLANTVTPV